MYGGRGKAARDWPSFEAIVRTLRTLGDDETLLVQSGRPVGVFATHEWAPRVLIANSNLVGDWATWDEFRRLEALGLTMYGQMTAGSWIYIGSQGILQGTYETFAAVAAKRFGDTLAGTITLTGGLGGMGGAQPLAVTMAGGVSICVDVDPSRIARRIQHGYLDVEADDADEALRLAVEARDARRPLSIGLLGNCATVVPRAAAPTAPRSTWSPTRPRAHDPLAYLPEGVAFEDWQSFARERAGGVHRARARVDGAPRGGDGRVPGRGRRGVRLRQLDPRRGQARRLRARLRVPRLRARLHPAAVLRGQGPLPLGGALRRPRGHRRDRPRGARAVPRERDAGALDAHGRREGAVPGAAGPDLLARVRRAPPAPACASTSWWRAARSRRRS